MHYPFAAIVGQEDMKLALLLNGINPGIGGVLISGVKGSGKSSASRGLAGLLPPIRANANCAFSCAPGDLCGECGDVQIEEMPTPFVSLPLGATEDRVLGSIDLEKAVRRGEKRLDPGLLARANGGILYLDEVNLLPDHLVDILLDVAASGVNRVEREGISVRHPARFILIGTMNPEEGELRPQLLDRFGLSVRAGNIADPAMRSEVVRRAIAFERDPDAFAGQWSAESATLREKIRRARERLPDIVIPDAIAEGISELCCRENVEGLRADIVIRKSAMTLAAWEGRTAAGPEDIARVREFALAHRRGDPPQPPPPPPPNPKERPKERPQEQLENSPPPQEDGLRRFDPQSEGPIRIPQPEARIRRSQNAPGGRGGFEQTGSRLGPYVRARMPKGKPSDLALDATLRAAVLRGGSKNPDAPGISIQPGDIRVKVRKPPLRRLYLFVLDASRSMGARRRMELTKGVLLGLLDEAYQKRDEVGLIVFQGTEARLILPPTRSVRRVQQSVRELPTGGKTPLAQGLRMAGEALLHSRRRHPGILPSVVLVSDGRPTAGIGGLDPIRSAERELHHLSQAGADLLFVDTEEGHLRLGMMGTWARGLNVPCLTLEELRPGRIRRLLDAA